MCGTRCGYVGLLKPRLGPFHVFYAVFLGIFLDAAAFNVLELHDVGQLFGVYAVRVVDIAVRVGTGDGFGTKVNEFLYRILGNVSCARDQHRLARKVNVSRPQHVL